MLEDKKVGAILARHPDHMLIVILDPSANDFAVRQLKSDNLLLFSQRLQLGRLLESLVGRGSTLLAKVRTAGLEGHSNILHKEP